MLRYHQGMFEIQFNDFNLKLIFKEISTENKDSQIEFLDVLHCVDNYSPKGFITKEYTKPTAKGHRFIDGRSHHPPHVFKGILIGEGKRLRRLNETNGDYQKSIDKLERKCLDSNFDRKMVKDTTDKIRKWQKRMMNTGVNEDQKNIKINRRITWTTQFKNILKIKGKEKHLVPNATITYGRPPTLGAQITNYKMIATEGNASILNPGSYACKSCGLCGNHGALENMVLNTDRILLPNNKSVGIKSAINCKDHGIYAARCRECHEFYVGQTKNAFSARWNSHRHNWKQTITPVGSRNNLIQDDKWREQNALFLHYRQKHQQRLCATLKLSDAYEVVFVENPKASKLDLRESVWIRKLNATINIAKTCLPKYQ